ncbi:hypothetical protein ACFMI7_20450, partial [Acinetobacter baumannii]
MKRSATSLIVSTVMLCTVGATSQIQAADTLAKIKSTGKIVFGVMPVYIRCMMQHDGNITLLGTT